jgi:hypothetical protein
MKKILYSIAILVGMVLMLTNCTKNFEEINTDPNNPTVAPSTNVLAHAIEDFTMDYFDDWGDMNEPSTYAGHLTKIQYIDEARYNFREGTVNNLWTSLYNNAVDVQLIIDVESQEGGNKNLAAAAMVWKAYMFSVGTDRWGNIPYSEALMGSTNTHPKYDAQKDIYAALLADLKTAAGMFDALSPFKLGEGDILFGGDTDKWVKFANSLRVRLAMRMSEVDAAGAKTIIEEVFADGNLMASNDDNAFLHWAGGNYKEPWNDNSLTRDDHGMANTLVDMLIDKNDPRLAAYAKPNDDGDYIGLAVGAFDGSFDMAKISRIGAMYRDDATGFSPIMRYAEVLFIAAEGAAKGWNTGYTAEDAYNMGVTASMEEAGVEIGDYLTNNAYADLTSIYEQKWIALFKNGQEAWALSRRTDVPLMEDAESSPFTGHNRPPFRYPYPTDEFGLNGANLDPELSGIIDQFWGKQMWWDTRTGVN